jgi:hypothetical protein
MGLLELVIVLAVIGVLLWAFNTYVTAIDGGIKKLINIVVIVVCVLIVLSAFGFFNVIHDVRVPQIR